MEKRGEIQNLIQVWITVILSLSYCYTISKITSKGLTRLLTIIPVICLFLALPLKLNSIHLGSITAFFIAWLANFKLLLFAFNKGPLCSDPSIISLLRFIAVGCLPIKIINPKIDCDPIEIGQNKKHPLSKKAQNLTKVLILAVMFRVYAYSDYIHPKVIWILYCVHVYLCLDFVLSIVAVSVRVLLGLELEQQFNEPYLSTSLQEFWGRRWNIMATSILHSTVYDPALYLSSKIVRRKWAPLPAVMATFVVSGLMHELIFYYLGRVWPTWEITWFFVLNGACVAGEIVLKKKIDGRYRLNKFVSGIMTVGFVSIMGLCFFVPQVLRCNAVERVIGEYAALGAWVEHLGTQLSDALVRIFNRTA